MPTSDLAPIAVRILYGLRCSTAACAAYALAMLTAPQHALWAPISALIVSQDTMAHTLSFVEGRSKGVVIGALVAVLVGFVGSLVGLALIAKVGVAVALSAAISMGPSAVRAAMWLSAIVLMVTGGQSPVPIAALLAVQVILGAVVGGLCTVLFNAMSSSRVVHRMMLRTR